MRKIQLSEQTNMLTKLDKNLKRMNEMFFGGSEDESSKPILFSNKYILNALSRAGFRLRESDYDKYYDVLVATAKYLKLATRTQNQSKKIIDLRELVYDTCNFDNDKLPPEMSDDSKKIFQALIDGDDAEHMQHDSEADAVINPVLDNEFKTNNDLNGAMDYEHPEETYADEDEFTQMNTRRMPPIGRDRLNEQVKRMKSLTKFIK